ncbi:MAG: LSU ribosomal protein L10p (P0) [Parcubacteria group bacterium Greene0714_21]|nr:MAG: LSU ribosomal protein L10p (P0) [Parcubacteria group bacterium Greene0416_39]TSC98525.1 MAG: LSU ribosomal protein L10p (P0) [Parcubacteria group bacterium Greene1014_47]TSD04286.1 MAG: LSU ribosomal protein L10p (P0) [Parcubacteria group bacterium Greene0714_21]
MAKTKAQKQTIIDKLEQQVEKTPSMVFVDVAGLKIKDLGVLRASLKKTGAKLQVVKKTLLAKTLDKKGIKAELKTMTGEIAAIFSQDPFAVLKLAYAFSKKNEHFKLRGGNLDGAVQNETAVILLAQLPAREELLSQLMRTLTGPVSGFMNVLQGNTKGLIRVLAQAKTS